MSNTKESSWSLEVLKSALSATDSTVQPIAAEVAVVVAAVVVLAAAADVVAAVVVVVIAPGHTSSDVAVE